MNSLPIPEGAARVTIDAIQIHPLDTRVVYRATVTRSVLTPAGHRAPFVEFVAEHTDECVVRRALRRRGYPSSRRLVPVTK